MADPRDLLASVGSIRYGVPTGEKERLARQSTLPGSPQDTSESQEAADRYAAGFLFGFNNPSLAPTIMQFVNRLKTSDLPGLGGDSPELQSYAVHGMQMGIQEALKGTTLEDLIQPSQASALE